MRVLYLARPEAILAALTGRGPLDLWGTLALALFYFASLNLVLAVFNLLPIPPLDGSKILQSLLPLRWHRMLWQLERYSWLSFVLIFTVLRDPIQAVIRWSQAAFFDLFF